MTLGRQLEYHYRLSIKGPDRTVAGENLEGSRVTLLPLVMDYPCARLVMEWKNPMGKYFQLKGATHKYRELRLPRECLPILNDVVRTIHFVSRGIDIRDVDGNSLVNHGRDITLTLHEIDQALTENKSLRDGFIELWEFHTKLKFEDAFFGETNESSTVEPYYLASAFVPRLNQRPNLTFSLGKSGQGLFINRISKHIAASMPIQVGDLLWLINKFLEVYYPTGGRIDTCKPSIPNPPGTMVWPLLAE